MKKVYITGVSGTGKSTITEELARRGIFAVSTDAIEGLCCWRNKKTREKIKYDFNGDENWFEN